MMKIDSEMLSRQLNRMHEKKAAQLDRTLIMADGSANETFSAIGYLAAIDQVLVMIHSLPEGAK